MPKELPFVRTSICKRGKTHILLDLFAKNTECTRGKKFGNLILNWPKGSRMENMRILDKVFKDAKNTAHITENYSIYACAE